ncbi:hypothetical protein [Streptomyces sp. NPDC002054]|uniref:hypothetical protein n=1 Tax=Streptomyces sp. NPDC002054 TaxID=3154663 RepID=UPI0033258D94
MPVPTPSSARRGGGGLLRTLGLPAVRGHGRPGRQAEAMGEQARVTAAYDGQRMAAFSLYCHFGSTAWLRAKQLRGAEVTGLYVLRCQGVSCR